MLDESCGRVDEAIQARKHLACESQEQGDSGMTAISTPAPVTELAVTGAAETGDWLAAYGRYFFVLQALRCGLAGLVLRVLTADADADAAAMVATLDTDGDGLISRAEFLPPGGDSDASEGLLENWADLVMLLLAAVACKMPTLPAMVAAHLASLAGHVGAAAAVPGVGITAVWAASTELCFVAAGTLAVVRGTGSKQQVVIHWLFSPSCSKQSLIKSSRMLCRVCRAAG